MSEHVVTNPNGEDREKLLPVAATIFGLYLIILSVGYFVGNLVQ